MSGTHLERESVINSADDKSCKISKQYLEKSPVAVQLPRPTPEIACYETALFSVLVRMSNVCEVCQKEAFQTCSACGQASYCCKSHQKEDWKKHKKVCVCYKIVTDDNLGRCVVATRPIKPGEVIMKNSPLILGPKTVSSPICLGCHKKLNPITFYCKNCHWPLCCDLCERSPLHEVECHVFAKSGYKPYVKNDVSKQSVYSSIAPLRALLLKTKEPKNFGLLLNCQSHLDQHLATPVYQILKLNLVPFFLNVLKIETNEREILTICSIFDTNCFDVRLGPSNARGLYPKVSFLSHDCRHNTKHHFQDNGDIVVKATVPINKGDLITTTYTQTLWGTLERRAHLKMAKLFDCGCDRCKDPTEFGTFLSATKCTQCKNGKVISCNPLDSKADFQCNQCGFLMSEDEVVWMNAAFKNEISLLDKSNPENLENFLRKYEEVLYGCNSFSLQVKYALTQLYGKVEGFFLKELNDEYLNRKVDLCKELLDVANILEPGYSTFRGLLLRDLYEALMEKSRREQKVVKEETLKLLEEAEIILKTDIDIKLKIY